MTQTIRPLKGSIFLPGDKSISHRVVMLGSLANGKTTVSNISDGGDVANTIACLSKLGAKFEVDGTNIEVHGVGLRSLNGSDLELDCGNSGTSLRLLCGLLSGQNLKNVSLIGDESLSRRPHDRVIKPLQSIGVEITGRDGIFTPVTINQSQPHAGQVEMTVASAQVKSAVLLAGLYGDGPVTVIEKEKTRDHTENMLKAMGANIVVEDQKDQRRITITPSDADLLPLKGAVPGDPSSGAFFCVAGLVIPGSDITIENMLLNPTRIAWISVLKSMGANISIEQSSDTFGEPVGKVRVVYSKLNAVDVNSEIASMVDELPILSLAMACAVGTSRVTNASELRVKESDRISVVVDHLTRAGIWVKELEDGYEIQGGQINDIEVIPDGDHRIAMTFEILNYLACGDLSTKNIEVVSTSFPRFFEMFQSLIDSN